jgi:hypothetical protein
MFGGNGGILGFTIGNTKYPKGPLGSNPPPPRSDGSPTKIMSNFLGISICILTRSVPLGVYGLDFIPVMVWVGVIVNGTSALTIQA